MQSEVLGQNGVVVLDKTTDLVRHEGRTGTQHQDGQGRGSQSVLLGLQLSRAWHGDMSDLRPARGMSSWQLRLKHRLTPMMHRWRPRIFRRSSTNGRWPRVGTTCGRRVNRCSGRRSSRATHATGVGGHRRIRDRPGTTDRTTTTAQRRPRAPWALAVLGDMTSLFTTKAARRPGAACGDMVKS